MPPLTHTRTFRVRQYECDAYGHVNHAVHLRWAQETAFDASAAAGYDMDRYDAMDRGWLVRETEIEYVRPLFYNDRVDVTTWVSDFRRLRSRRDYEFRMANTDTLVARAWTDWVHMQTSTQRPAAIPEEMMAAFFPDGPPEETPERTRFPAPPPPGPKVYRHRREVDWRDLDQMGHVNNAIYLNYIGDCGLRALSSLGYSFERLSRDGIGIVARAHRLEYKAAAVLGDELEVATWLTDAKGKTVLRHSTVTRVRDSQLLLRSRTVHVWVDIHTGRPVQVPDGFINALKGDQPSDSRS
jgi:acyl-CoA thioester hydrolase